MPTIKGGVKLERGKPIPSKILKVTRKERLLPFRADGWKSDSPKLDELVMGTSEEKSATTKRRKSSRRLPSFRKFRREKKTKFQKIEDLIKIDGIGKETLSDIRVVWRNLEDLIDDLKNNRHIPLRNDVVEKLRKELL